MSMETHVIYTTSSIRLQLQDEDGALKGNGIPLNATFHNRLDTNYLTLSLMYISLCIPVAKLTWV